jgi:hypothetical protein
MTSPAERENIEEEYFADEQVYQEMLAIQNDLIDAYVRGELMGEERQGFEKSFLSSRRGREQVEFARAFVATVSATESFETTHQSKWLDIFKLFQSPYLYRTATIALLFVCVMALAWLVNDRRKMTNELRDPRSEFIAVSKPTEELQPGNNTEQVATAEIAGRLAKPPGRSDKQRDRRREIIVKQRVRHLTEVKNDRGKTTRSRPEPVEKLAFLRNASIDSVSVEPLNSFFLIPRNLINSGGAAIQGMVRDPQGNPVSSATVTLSEPTTNFVRSQSTNEDGTYLFPAIRPGRYSLRVEAKGFKTMVLSDLAAISTRPTVVDTPLEIGAVTDTISVSVSAGETLINTTDSYLGNNFVSQQITQLPLYARNVADLLSLQPDVTPTGSANSDRSDQANLTLDGVDLSNFRVIGVDLPNFRVIGVDLPNFIRLIGDGQTIYIPNSLNWVRFEIAIQSDAIHEDYVVTIETAEDRAVTYENWSEPYTSNQYILETPAIATGGLPSGQYVLSLMGKMYDGSFVKVAEYSFEVIRY